MNSLYTSSVTAVPKKLTEPTPAYKKHVWLALGGIVFFFLSYLLLSFWFSYTAYRLLNNAFSGGQDAFLSGAIGIAVAFLAIFMVKALFFVQTKYDVEDKEIKQKDEPLLFDFLYKLADETGAPRPAKVYLSNRVNACVFYDLSILNLLFPSKKNLEIGLGLINVLNLGEFKAVLAHEFGHFAQRSMLVGRWVYIANQIANAIINRRDILDSFLSGLSRIDIRIAWIGWILSLIVWSIRSLVELFFRIVVLSQRALSREMEFQADLVAVSVTGSDALVHALHKLQAADQAFSEAMSTAESELGNKKAVEDIYALQTNAIEKISWILNDKTFGNSPVIPEENPENFRVFSSKIAQPPKMWATHPPDQEREANAKHFYIPGFIDDRSPWILFDNPGQTKLELTKNLIQLAKIETELLPVEDSILAQNKKYSKSYFDPKYKGAYLKRFFCLDYNRSSDMYLKENIEPLFEVVDNLYPNTLVADIEDYSTLREEAALLEAIQYKQLSAAGEGKGIWHRGTPVERKELPEIIKNVNKEVELARQKLAKHDQVCRTAHLKLASQIGHGWEEYLEGNLEVIHYAEHSITNLNDLTGVLGNVFSIAIADGNVSEKELRKLLIASGDLYEAMRDIHKDSTTIHLDKLLLEELKVDSWEKELEEFTLPYPNRENLDGWMKVIDGWVQGLIASLSRLRSEALEVLLKTEENVQQMAKTNKVTIAPAPSKLVDTYAILMPGDERPIQRTLGWWDKFATADGILPALVRFGVAASIVGATVFMVGSFGASELSIYNAMGEPVKLNLGGKNRTISANSFVNISFSPGKDFTITAKTKDGHLIERFKPELLSNSSHYVYNVASIASLYQYKMYYGRPPQDNNKFLGNQRWTITRADHIFEDPPESISTSSDYEVRDCLTTIKDADPFNVIEQLSPEKSKEIIEINARWRSAESSSINGWFFLAKDFENFEDIINSRLERTPNEVIAIRAIQDLGKPEQRKAICEKMERLSSSSPDNGNLAYLTLRCMEDLDKKDQNYIKSFEEHPKNGWLANAAGYSFLRNSDWLDAHVAYVRAYQELPVFRNQLRERIDRIERVLSINKIASFSRVGFPPSDDLEYYQTLETGTSDEFINSPEFIFNSLGKGRLQQAARKAKFDNIYLTDITVLLACSDGAKKEWIDSTLSLINFDEVSDYNLFYIAALRASANKDLTKIYAALEETDVEFAETAKQFITLIKANKINAAEELFKTEHIRFKGTLYAMGQILLGVKAPADWKKMSNALLYYSERPYFKPPKKIAM